MNPEDLVLRSLSKMNKDIEDILLRKMDEEEMLEMQNVLNKKIQTE